MHHEYEYPERGRRVSGGRSGRGSWPGAQSAGSVTRSSRRNVGAGSSMLARDALRSGHRPTQSSACSATAAKGYLNVRRIDEVGDLVDRLGTGGRGPPDDPDRAAGAGPGELGNGDRGVALHLDGDRRGRQQGDAEAGGNHLHHRAEAGALDLGAAAPAGQVADVQRLVPQAVALLQQHQRLGGEVLGAARAPLDQAVALGRGQHEGLGVELSRLQSGTVDRQRQDPGVDAAIGQLAQQAVGLLLVEVQLDAGQLPPQPAHEARHQVGGHGRDHAEVQRSDTRLGETLGGRDQVVDLGQYAPRPGDEVLARRGQEHAPSGALEERDAEPSLQLADLGAERGLADVGGRRGPAEVPLVGHGHGIAKLLNRRRAHRSSLLTRERTCPGPGLRSGRDSPHATNPRGPKP